ncbi:MAG: fatty acid desaturase [Pseudanabaenaceae cyanobacterium SKYGB_i_bin29]|nr:fatty acid desaturase [Pseudanabaenaceae cyanobacterium SKYG29]MDW8421459.1 fatty acid desaturase [Pseudanabaenaceae cyanobacterium SKYGB_i_bin29]
MQEAGQTTLTPIEFMGAPEGFNPTLALLIFAVILFALSTTGYWLWHWYPPLVFFLNFVSLYVLGTVIHDASHGVAHRNRIVNAVMGHISALLQGFVYPVFTRVHMQHHAHVNDPENDPDHFVSTGGPLWLIAVRFFYHEVFFFQRRLWRKWELWEWFFSRLLLVIVLTLGYYYGFLSYILTYWFGPAGIMGLLLGLFFDYLPHRPFQERSRWKNARVYPGWLLNILLLGQNYHLIHHLWPNIPWYNYQPAYYKMKPLLDAHGSPQSLGLWQLPDLGGFIYDIFLGIRFHHHK